MSMSHDRDAEIALKLPEATDLLFIEVGDGTWCCYGHPRMTIPKAVVSETGVNYQPITKHVIHQDNMLEVTRWADNEAQLYYHLAVWRKSRYITGEHTDLVVVFSTRPETQRRIPVQHPVMGDNSHIVSISSLF